MPTHRYKRELVLLEKDYADPGGADDCRLLYYLGVDHGAVLGIWKQEALAAAGEGGHSTWTRHLDLGLDLGAGPGGGGSGGGGRSSAAFEAHWKAGVGYLRRRVVDLAGSDGGHAEMQWASALWLGRMLHDLRPAGQGALFFCFAPFWARTRSFKNCF